MFFSYFNGVTLRTAKFLHIADTLNFYNHNLSNSVSEILNDELNDVNILYGELCNAIKLKARTLSYRELNIDSM